MVMPRFPAYGHNGTMLIFPVLMEIARIDRPGGRAAPDPAYDDIFDEKVRDQDGTEHVLYHTAADILAQFLPLSVTDHANRQVPGISGNDKSWKSRWVLSKIDLTARGLIDVPTGRPLIQPGDRVLKTKDRDPPNRIFEDYTHSEVIIKEIHQRTPNDDSFFLIFLEDVAKGSQILS
jgi:hypothetical protein